MAVWRKGSTLRGTSSGEQDRRKGSLFRQRASSLGAGRFRAGMLHARTRRLAGTLPGLARGQEGSRAGVPRAGDAAGGVHILAVSGAPRRDVVQQLAHLRSEDPGALAPPCGPRAATPTRLRACTEQPYAPRPSIGRPARHACNHIIAATAHRLAAQPPRACTARCGARLLSARLVPRLCPRGASTPRRLAASAVPNPIPYTCRCRRGHCRRARRPVARSGRGDDKPRATRRCRRRGGGAVARGGRQPRAALRARGARRAARSA